MRFMYITALLVCIYAALARYQRFRILILCDTVQDFVRFWNVVHLNCGLAHTQIHE